MTTYLGGSAAGGPSKTIEGITASGGDIDFISSDASITITANDANDTIDLVAAPPAAGSGWTDDGTVVRLNTSTDKVGIGTSSPQAQLEVGGNPGTSVGGFPSGNLHVTGQSALVNANSVITGHNLNGGNKQLWYFGSVSSSNDSIAFINRQNGSLSFFSNNISRVNIEAAGNVIFEEKIRIKGGAPDAGKVLTSDAIGLASWATPAAADPITLGTEIATTSGTEHDFTGIPSGTKRIVITFEGVSLSSANEFLIQLGDSVGFEATGYVSSGTLLVNSGSVAVDSDTNGFVIDRSNASDIFSGHMTLLLSDSANNTWISSYSGKHNVNKVTMGGGEKSLSAELTQVRITRRTSGTFDAGAVNIQHQK